MDLQDKSKHDQLCIARRGDENKFKYKFIRGQVKHINKILKENEVNKDDIIIQLYIPAGINFFNKIKEEVALHRERVYIDKTSGESIDEDDIVQDREYRVSTTNNFNIIGMTEEQFRCKTLEVFKSSF